MAATKMIVGRIWKANTKPSSAVPLASPTFTGSCAPPWTPSASKTNSEPTYERFSTRVIFAPTQEKSSCPIGVLSTKSASASCSPSPHAIVRPRIALRSVDSAQAIARITTMPKSEKSRSMWRRASLVEDFEDERSARGRLRAHHDRLPQAGERLLAPGGLAEVHRHDRLAGRDRVADLLVEHEADRGGDLAVAPSPPRRRR